MKPMLRRLIVRWMHGKSRLRFARPRLPRYYRKCTKLVLRTGDTFPLASQIELAIGGHSSSNIGVASRASGNSTFAQLRPARPQIQRCWDRPPRGRFGTGIEVCPHRFETSFHAWARRQWAKWFARESFQKIVRRKQRRSVGLVAIAPRLGRALRLVGLFHEEKWSTADRCLAGDLYG